MPLYEYRCKSCDHQFEITQAFSDDALTTCPECEGTLKKVFSPVGISFKGSGFYKNDSRGSGSSSSSSGSSPSSASSSDGGSDTTSSSSSSSSSSKETASSSSSTSTTSSD